MTDGFDPNFDLTGAWQGLFHYPIAKPPVPFTAELTDTEGGLLGSTMETGEIGDAAGRTLSATLQGRRDGRAVKWLKIYDAEYAHYDAVRYEGVVSADGLEIEGRWIVARHWSGTFLMIRPAGLAKAAEVKIAAPV